MSEAGGSLLPPSRNIDEVVGISGQQYNERRNQIPQVPQSQNLLLGFITALFDALYLMVISIATNLSRRISAVETSVEAMQEDDEEETVEASAASAAPPTTTTTPRTTRSARPKRCQKCHARGHDVIECRTADPAAMRRRVASNSRLAKQARADRSTMPSTSTPAPSYIPYQPPLSSYPVVPPPVNFANLVADATELRRRAAQSTRDRRINRRRQSSTTS
jgi:hypothetical protein